MEMAGDRVTESSCLEKTPKRGQEGRCVAGWKRETEKIN